MTTLETRVAEHYQVGGLLETILEAAGGEDGQLDTAALALVGEFHLGGVPATERLVPHLNLRPGSRCLDVGSGIGGPARLVAAKTGAEVTGIDLTESYCRIAGELSRRTGVADRTRFVTGSAIDLPFGDAEFDAAMLLHVGMNIEDKARLAAEVWRVLKPGGTFAVYDVMRTGDGEPDYPLPWASDPGSSFVEAPEAYRRLVEAAGFTTVAEAPRRDEALAFLKATRDRVEAARAQGLPPPPGVNLVMEDAPAKLGNLGAAVMAGTFAPVELIFRKGSR